MFFQFVLVLLRWEPPFHCILICISHCQPRGGSTALTVFGWWESGKKTLEFAALNTHSSQNMEKSPPDAKDFQQNNGSKFGPKHFIAIHPRKIQILR